MQKAKLTHAHSNSDCCFCIYIHTYNMYVRTHMCWWVTMAALMAQVDSSSCCCCCWGCCRCRCFYFWSMPCLLRRCRCCSCYPSSLWKERKIPYTLLAALPPQIGKAWRITYTHIHRKHSGEQKPQLSNLGNFAVVSSMLSISFSFPFRKFSFIKLLLKLNHF